MIRQLAQCPYCEGCEVALTEEMELIFSPDTSPSRPCAHLVWVEGRYSQWGLSPLPGRKTKIARRIGSSEFGWQHPTLAGHDDVQELMAFLRDLLTAGGDWQFAPNETHAVRIMSADHNVTESDGRVYPDWEVEGSALFATDPARFIASLPACRERQGSAFTDLTGLGE
jgi:hypothetical protein